MLAGIHFLKIIYMGTIEKNGAFNGTDIGLVLWSLLSFQRQSFIRTLNTQKYFEISWWTWALFDSASNK